MSNVISTTATSKAAEQFTHLYAVMHQRGGKALWYKFAYRGELTSSEKDEVLICSRIAKARMSS